LHSNCIIRCSAPEKATGRVTARLPLSRTRRPVRWRRRSGCQPISPRALTGGQNATSPDGEDAKTVRLSAKYHDDREPDQEGNPRNYEPDQNHRCDNDPDESFVGEMFPRRNRRSSLFRRCLDVFRTATVGAVLWSDVHDLGPRTRRSG
jgi:hypothetical protein